MMARAGLEKGQEDAAEAEETAAVGQRILEAVVPS
jgi:hypothetical protein